MADLSFFILLDNIRKMDWVPRTLRQKQKQLDKTLNELEIELGRFPTDEEIAKKLDIKVEEVGKLIQETNVSSIISLEDYTEQQLLAFFFFFLTRVLKASRLDKMYKSLDKIDEDFND